MELPLNLISVICIFAIGLGIFFLAYLIFTEKKRWGDKKVLIAILLVLISQLFYDLLIFSSLIYQLPFLFGLNGFGGLLLYPLLYFYIVSLKKEHWHWHWWYGLAFVPFLIGFTYKSTRYLPIKASDKIEMLDAFYRHTRPGPTNLFTNEMLLLAKVILPALFLIGAIYQLRLLKKERNQALPVYLKGMQWVLALALVYVLGANFLNQGLYSWWGNNFIEWIVNIALMAAFLVMLAFLMLKQLERGDELFPEEKYKDSRLDKAASRKYYLQLLHLVEKEELYLDANLTLSALAKKMEVNSKYLSQAINENCDLSFTRFINQYRVKKAQQLLKDPALSNYTIEGIASEAGFRSKSAFYKAFKEWTGISPKDFQSRSDS